MKTFITRASAPTPVTAFNTGEVDKIRAEMKKLGFKLSLGFDESFDKGKDYSGNLLFTGKFFKLALHGSTGNGRNFKSYLSVSVSGHVGVLESATSSPIPEEFDAEYANARKAIKFLSAYVGKGVLPK